GGRSVGHPGLVAVEAVVRAEDEAAVHHGQPAGHPGPHGPTIIDVAGRIHVLHEPDLRGPQGYGEGEQDKTGLENLRSRCHGDLSGIVADRETNGARKRRRGSTVAPSWVPEVPENGKGRAKGWRRRRATPGASQR